MQACQHVTTTRKRTRDTAAGAKASARRRGRAHSEASSSLATAFVDVDDGGGGAECEQQQQQHSSNSNSSSSGKDDDNVTPPQRHSNKDDSSNDADDDSRTSSSHNDDAAAAVATAAADTDVVVDKTTHAQPSAARAPGTAASARLAGGNDSSSGHAVTNTTTTATTTTAAAAGRASDERRRGNTHSHSRTPHTHHHRTRPGETEERVDVSPSKPRCGSNGSSGGVVVAAASSAATQTAAAGGGSNNTPRLAAAAAASSCVVVDASTALVAGEGASSTTALMMMAAAAAAGDVHNNSTSSSSSNNSSGGAAAAAGCDGRRYKQPTLAAYGLVTDTATLRKELIERQEQLEEALRRVAALEDATRRRDEELTYAQRQHSAVHARLQRFRAVMREEMLRTARQSRAEARRVLHARHFELGHIAVLPHNGREVWVEGDAVRNVLVQLRQLQARRDVVEQQKKDAQALIKQLGRHDKEREEVATAAAAATMTTAATTTTTAATMTPAAALAGGGGGNNNNNGSSSNATAAAAVTATQDVYEALLHAQTELQLRTAEHAALTAALTTLRERHTALEHEKKAFLKEIRRVNDEDASEFVAVAAIGEEGRYVLMHLLGKGGFSEVWCAFDLVEARYVACKVHRVSPEWPSATREHYLHHAKRELEIMRCVRHPHVVQLYDVFHLGESAFVSVMEYSHGVDLDTYLKRYHTLREADARLVLLQVVSALRYLASLERPVIHYDLKPANVLFHSADTHVLEVKITDFGLSKLLPRSSNNNGNNSSSSNSDGNNGSSHTERRGGGCAGGPSDNPSIELTSQGTGTYWYLPPECFDTSSTTPPRISSKVDIWSVGVMFYQMLYGRRPFAEGESQRRIWQEQLIVHAARTLHFPDTPRVSEEAKALMRGCLAFHVAERYDIYQLSQHPYLTRTTRRSARSARTSSHHSSSSGGAAAATTTATMAPPAVLSPRPAAAAVMMSAPAASSDGAVVAAAAAHVTPPPPSTSAVPSLSHTAPPPSYTAHE